MLVKLCWIKDFEEEHTYIEGDSIDDVKQKCEAELSKRGMHVGCVAWVEPLKGVSK
jgi:hypothetical protein